MSDGEDYGSDFDEHEETVPKSPKKPEEPADDAPRSPKQAAVKADAFTQGQVVESRFGGDESFYPGKISRVVGDGTYDVAYDDGDSETAVPANFIRAPKAAPVTAPPSPKRPEEQPNVPTSTAAVRKASVKNRKQSAKGKVQNPGDEAPVDSDSDEEESDSDSDDNAEDVADGSTDDEDSDDEDSDSDDDDGTKLVKKGHDGKVADHMATKLQAAHRGYSTRKQSSKGPTSLADQASEKSEAKITKLQVANSALRKQLDRINRTLGSYVSAAKDQESASPEKLPQRAASQRENTAILLWKANLKVAKKRIKALEKHNGDLKRKLAENVVADRMQDLQTLVEEKQKYIDELERQAKTNKSMLRAQEKKLSAHLHEGPQLNQLNELHEDNAMLHARIKRLRHQKKQRDMEHSQRADDLKAVMAKHMDLEAKVQKLGDIKDIATAIRESKEAKKAAAAAEEESAKLKSNLRNSEKKVEYNMGQAKRVLEKVAAERDALKKSLDEHTASSSQREKEVRMQLLHVRQMKRELKELALAEHESIHGSASNLFPAMADMQQKKGRGNRGMPRQPSKESMPRQPSTEKFASGVPGGMNIRTRDKAGRLVQSNARGPAGLPVPQPPQYTSASVPGGRGRGGANVGGGGGDGGRAQRSRAYGRAMGKKSPQHSTSSLHSNISNRSEEYEGSEEQYYEQQQQQQQQNQQASPRKTTRQDAARKVQSMQRGRNGRAKAEMAKEKRLIAQRAGAAGLNRDDKMMNAEIRRNEDHALEFEHKRRMEDELEARRRVAAAEKMQQMERGRHARNTMKAKRAKAHHEAHALKEQLQQDRAAMKMQAMQRGRDARKKHLMDHSGGGVVHAHSGTGGGAEGGGRDDNDDDDGYGDDFDDDFEGEDGKEEERGGGAAQPRAVSPRITQAQESSDASRPWSGTPMKTKLGGRRRPSIIDLESQLEQASAVRNYVECARLQQQLEILNKQEQIEGKKDMAAAGKDNGKETEARAPQAAAAAAPAPAQQDGSFAKPMMFRPQKKKYF
jgi:hypothetical protein